MNAENEARDAENRLGARRYFELGQFLTELPTHTHGGDPISRRFDHQAKERTFYSGNIWDKETLARLLAGVPGAIEYVPNEIQGLHIDAIFFDDLAEDTEYVDERLLLLCPPSSF